MKVAITTPTTWPYVRRGAERFANEFARDLARRGHSVTIISGKPGKKEVIPGDGYITVCHRRLWYPFCAYFGLLEFHTFFFPCLYHLLRERFDVVVSLTFMDGLAAQLARKFNGSRSFLMLNGLPPKKPYFRALTLKGALFGRAVREADLVVGISDYVRQYLERRWQRECVALAPPVDTERFHPKPQEKSVAPLVVCAAALEDARKGGRALMRAFNILKQRRPDARLQLVTAVSPQTADALLSLVDKEWRGDVEFQPAGEDLPEMLSRATISVLPSLWEPYGMVVIESMAAGTPVVGAHDGALPELISNAGVGRLFDPGEDSDIEPSNIEGLAAALDECINLARQPGTSERCRDHATQYSWHKLGPVYEETLLRLVEGPQAEEALQR
jgi:phosphatidyl-myo-inositol alpha-mannosyltransferase